MSRSARGTMEYILEPGRLEVIALEGIPEIKPEWKALKDRHDDVKEAMAELVKTSIVNSPQARTAHQKLVEVQIAGDSVDCPTGKDCPRNLGRWPMDPVLSRGAQGTIILAPFEPGPSQAERRAVLTVYFSEGKRR